MENIPDIEVISAWITGLQTWAMQSVLTLAVLMQIVLVVVVAAIAVMAARKLAKWLEGQSSSWHKGYLSFISSHIYISKREIITLLFIPLMLWVAVTISAAAKIPYALTNAIASLISAWALIRLSSSIIKSPFWSQTVAVLLWVIAALNIMGWLEKAVDILDAAAISIGGHSVSLLILMKGGVIIALLLWLASVASEGLERALWRSHLSPSQKVLFHKLAKIFLIGLAVILSLNVVGIDFTALAVFSGALGIGIGFGLQKVFANLMSGFILLMDKSIKPGDVIAIEDTYGWVNRLGARYVSILTRDGKEHLIPNEALITERVENWSYSNDKIRIHIPIGAPYTSDLPLVKKLLLEAANKQPRILQDPKPVCLIKGFGDNSVDFEIRAWIKDPVNGISNVRSGVYEEVWQLFKEHDIVMPFPQRDLHFDIGQMQELIKMMKKS